MDELTISVKIADRPYRLTIKKEEEETVRKAAKSINENMKQFSEHYAFKDKQDLLAMTAILFASKALNFESMFERKNNKVIEKLTEIDQVLSKSIK